MSEIRVDTISEKTSANGVAVDGVTLKDGQIDLADSKKILLGNSDDLEIFHDGSHSMIVDTGQGNLKLRGDNLSLKNADDDEAYIDCVNDGAVIIYHDNSQKFTTTSSGVTIDAGLLINGATPTVTIGDGGAEDTKIVFDGNAQDFYIALDDSADDLIIGRGSTVGTSADIRLNADGDIGIATDPNNVDSGRTLHIKGHNSDGANIRLQSTGDTADTDDMVIQKNDTVGFIKLFGGDTFKVFTSGAERLAIDADGVVSITTSGNGDNLSLISTDADANAGPNLRLYRNSSSPADSDVLGQIDFEGRNDNSQDYVAAQIKTATGDVSDGTEDAQIEFDVMTGGTLREYLRMASGSEPSVVINEDGQDINFRVESDNNANMLFVDGGNDSVHIGSGTVETSDVLAVYSSATSTPIRFVNTNANSVAPSVIFQKNSSSPADDDEIGLINFIGQDDAGGANVYAQMVVVSTDVSNGSENGKIQFGNVNNGSYSIKLEIDSSGQVLCGDTLSAQNGQKLHSSRNDKAVSFGAENLHASLDGSICVAEISANATSSSGYRLLRGVSGNGSGSSFVDNEFIFQGNGDLSVDGSVGTGGADYAEMFEWKDGNSSSEDRRGYSVILDGNQIVKATDSDDASKIIGIVSAIPVVIGDSDIDDKWKYKYLKDDFGNYIMEEYTSTEWVEVIEDKDEEDKVINKRNIVQSYASDRIPSEVTVPSDATVRVVDADGNKFTRKKLNPDWDDSKTYVRRKNRKEWDAIGLMGKLRLRKGQPTGTNWIKMRDISDTVEEWLVR
jgi:hypothetical protein